MRPTTRTIGTILLSAWLLPLGGVSADEGAADEAESSVRELMGRWAAPCDAWGSPAACRLQWTEGLHDTHMIVSYTIDSREQAQRVFEGTGVYRVAGETLRGYWSDSGGAIHPLRASWQNRQLTTHWGIAGEKLGRTDYRLADDGALEVTDWILRTEGWHAFMQVRYLRAP